MTAEIFRLRNQFEAVKEKLLTVGYEERIKKPLSYWSMPNDRRLPMAFMDRAITTILATAFEDLCSTTGIGEKKLQMLIELLHRAIEGDPQAPPQPANTASLTNPTFASELELALDAFNHRNVTEGQWAKWKATIVRHRLQQIPLGRLARALSEVTTVIWTMPLGYYLAYSLDELRHLKTHGDKRVRSILEVFYTIELYMNNVPAGGHISVRLDPQFSVDVENAFLEIVNQSQLPTEKKVQQMVLKPIVEQLKLDVSELAYDLVRKRIGLDTEAKGVRDQSIALGLTRARVYQIMEECSEAIQVRWPRGRLLLGDLLIHLADRKGADHVVKQMQHLQTLLYPSRYQDE